MTMAGELQLRLTYLILMCCLTSTKASASFYDEPESSNVSPDIPRVLNTQFRRPDSVQDLRTYSKTHTRRSDTECALECSKDTRCLAFHFNRPQRQCFLASTDGTLGETHIYTTWLFRRVQVTDEQVIDNTFPHFSVASSVPVTRSSIDTVNNHSNTMGRHSETTTHQDSDGPESDDSNSNDSESTDSNSNNPETTNSHSNNPETTNSHSNDPETTNSYSNDPETTNSHSNNPETTNSHSNDPETTNSYSNDPLTTYSHSNVPDTTDSHSNGTLATDPGTTDSHSNDPKTPDSHRNDLETTHSHSNDPEATDSHSNDPETTDSHTNVPETTDSHSNDPVTTDSHTNVPETTDYNSDVTTTMYIPENADSDDFDTINPADTWANTNMFVTSRNRIDLTTSDNRHNTGSTRYTRSSGGSSSRQDGQTSRGWSWQPYTGQSGYTTSRQSGYTTSRQSGYTTSRQGGYTTSRQSGYTTSRQSGYTTSRQSGYTTSRQSGYTTSRQSGYTTSRQSGYTTSRQSGYTTSRQGGYTTSRQIGYTTSRQSGQSEAIGGIWYDRKSPQCYFDYIPSLNKCVHINSILLPWALAQYNCEQAMNGKIIEFASVSEFMTFREIVLSDPKLNKSDWHVGFWNSTDGIWKWFSSGIVVPYNQSMWATNKPSVASNTMAGQQAASFPYQNWSFPFSSYPWGNQWPGTSQSQSFCGGIMASDAFLMSADLCQSGTQRYFMCQYTLNT